MKLLLALILPVMMGFSAISEPQQVNAVVVPKKPIPVLQWNPGSDRYRFEQYQFVQTEFKMTVKLSNTYDEIDWDMVGIRGKANIDPKKGECTIYIVDPRRVYEPEWLGHELVHCVFGQWHPNQTAAGQ